MAGSGTESLNAALKGSYAKGTLVFQAAHLAMLDKRDR